ncbi:MAG: hypothetical protein ACREQE_01310 [Candidatus Binataceae bacterium]
MELTDQQIERYSRQILVGQIGGSGQERLLQSRLLIVGESEDVGPVLAYMAGAGVGVIHLRAGSADDAQEAARRAGLIAQTRILNRDVSVSLAREFSPGYSLTLALIGSAAALEDARGLCTTPDRASMVFARLTEAGQIAVLSSRPPCPICADFRLMAPFTQRAGNARLIAMLAAAEALKLLANASTPLPALIEFDGYATRTRPLSATVDARPTDTDRCACTLIAKRVAGARDE